MKREPKLELTQGEHAYRQLRGMIVNCELSPGSSVSEPELTLLLDKRKAAVRAALIRLTHDGLITAVPRSGYRVAPLEVKDALELTQLRLLTEPRAFKLATERIDPAIIQLAKKRYSAGYDRANPRSVSLFLAQSREFKLAVAQASGNRRLAVWVAEVSECVDRYLRLSFTKFDWEPIVSDHLLPLCTAMENGKAQEAEELAIKNIHAVTAKIMSALLHDGGNPQDVRFGFAATQEMIGSKLAELA